MIKIYSGVNEMILPARAFLVAHVVYAISLAALSLGVLARSFEPEIELWPVNVTVAVLPLALIFAFGAAMILVGIRDWARSGRQGVLFAIDWAVPVFAAISLGPGALDPAFLIANVPVVGLVALSIVCGILLLIVPPTSKRAS